LNAWHEVANISFTFTSGAANITYNHNGSSTAVTSDTFSGTSLTSATVDISSNWWPNTNIYSYMYQTYIHETGHALGLGHEGPYDGSATYGVNNIYTNDTWQWSVMSYNSQN
jgi:serralysin